MNRKPQKFHFSSETGLYINIYALHWTCRSERVLVKKILKSDRFENQNRNGN
jgi:hypothetical protein